MERLATSDFTLNFNPGARGNDKAPTLKGKARVALGFPARPAAVPFHRALAQADRPA